MRISKPFALAVALSIAPSTALNILMNNDDGFGSGNIRELYKMLKADGHNVVIVAPATDQSGQGGRSVFTTNVNLTAPSEFNIVPAGSPSLGTDPNDSSIWYYNGTPAACTFVALDFVLPRHFPNFGSPDLLVSGPNFGTNLGPFLYTLSGTIGATYSAVERSIPAIAFSASNPSIPFFNVTNTTNPATYAAAAAHKVVRQFIDATPKGQAILPLGYGVNVNIPPLSNSTIPPIVATRLTGEADVDIAAYNETTGLFTFGNIEPKAAGVNACYNGDCSLPGESFVVEGGGISVSVFTVDYDAPDNDYTTDVFKKFAPVTTSSKSYSRMTRRGASRRAFVRRNPN